MPFDIPGHKNSIPVCVEGVGLAVVDAARARVRVRRANIVDSGKGGRWQRMSKDWIETFDPNFQERYKLS